MAMERSANAAIMKPMQSHINIGNGQDISMGRVAHLVGKVMRYTGRIGFDTSKSDAAPRKLLVMSTIETLGCAPTSSVESGLRESYQDFLLRWAAP